MLTAIGLLNHADDFGFFEADHRVIKAKLWSLKDPTVPIRACLMELVSIGYIHLHVAPSGRLVGWVINFLEHQVINKPSKSSKLKVAFESGIKATEFYPLDTATESLPLQPPSTVPALPPALPEGPEKKEEVALPEESCRFVDWFVELLQKTGAPPVKLTDSVRRSWADTYDKLIRLDGRTKEQVKIVCRWAREDTFWRKNFLSPAKLREKSGGVQQFDRFLAKMQDGGTGAAKVSFYELQQRERRIVEEIEKLKATGQEYVSGEPGKLPHKRWKPEAMQQHDELQADLRAVRAQMAKRPE